MRNHPTSILILVGLAALAATEASGRPAGGSVEYKKGYLFDAWSVAVPAGKTGTGFTIEKRHRLSGAWSSTGISGTAPAAAPGSGSTTSDSVMHGDVRLPSAAINDRVRIKWANTSTSGTGPVLDACILDSFCSAPVFEGSATALGVGFEFCQNFAQGVALRGVTSMVAGTEVTVTLPQQFSWLGAPGVVATDPGDLTVGAAAIRDAQRATFLVLSNSQLNEYSGFSLTGGIFYNGSAFTPGVRPVINVSGLAMLNGEVGMGSADVDLFTIVPAPGSAALAFGAAALIARRRRA